MPTTISTLIWRDFLGTHVHPGRSRHRPEKMKMQSVCDYDYYRKLKLISIGFVLYF